MRVAAKGFSQLRSASLARAPAGAGKASHACRRRTGNPGRCADNPGSRWRCAPSSRARRSCRDVGRAERAILETEGQHRRLIDRMAAHRVRLQRLHGSISPTRMPQQVDVMDQVDQHRAAAGLPPPGDVEIGIWLEDPEEGMRGDDAAELARGDRLLGARDQRIVAAVMADHQRHAGRLSSRDELARALDVSAIGFSTSVGRPAATARGHARHAGCSAWRR